MSIADNVTQLIGHTPLVRLNPIPPGSADNGCPSHRKVYSWQGNVDSRYPQSIEPSIAISSGCCPTEVFLQLTE
ncbi:MAG: hypothetical protein AAGA46_13070 [Cyanobacteria bacterium P01_F01_bin.13]